MTFVLMHWIIQVQKLRQIWITPRKFNILTFTRFQTKSSNSILILKPVSQDVKIFSNHLRVFFKTRFGLRIWRFCGELKQLLNKKLRFIFGKKRWLLNLAPTFHVTYQKPLNRKWVSFFVQITTSLWVELTSALEHSILSFFLKGNN